MFAAQLTAARLDGLLPKVTVLIKPNEVDIRAYPLPSTGNVALLGTQLFPDDVLLIRNGHNALRLGADRQAL